MYVDELAKKKGIPLTKKFRKKTYTIKEVMVTKRTAKLFAEYLRATGKSVVIDDKVKGYFAVYARAKKRKKGKK